MIRALIIAILLLLGVIVWQRGSLALSHRAADSALAARDDARAQLSEVGRTLAQERANTTAANRLAAQYEKERVDAQAVSDRVVADLRSGNVRLHQRWQAAVATSQLSAAAAAAAQSDGRTDDRIESAGRAIGAAAQCDAQVRGLQELARLCSTAGVP
ncbi:TPA: endopeptidase [Stenotrophomonas maltophilia]|nr:endopeptidase [Stenotrophomonas maltophilia]HDS1155665.1 endopeptidase [Stenotrophomonas maltophilia]HDS1164325.1 endopeptidase [Stenotrophomonas maltophilia]HDS1170242.1 endopeptidase [Stenotrophomonas maltophilia]HDS1176029.1 endopeptidase [Stenotrophomonas maltophilia]